MQLIEAHRKKCSNCGLCLDWGPLHLNGCAQYDSFHLVSELYDYIEGKTDRLPGQDIFKCFMCSRCKQECPENLGIIDLIRAARAKWYEENGLQPISFHVDTESETNIFSTMDRSVEIPTYPEKTGEIVYRPGCYATHLHPYICLSSTRLLDLAGIDYWVQIDRPGDSTCCGMVAASQSNKGPVMRQAKKNVDELKEKGTKKMLITCPVCYKAFKFAYPGLFGDLGVEVIHITEFLNQLVKEGKLTPGRLDRKVYYHDPCHMSIGLGVSEAPRELLISIPGTQLLNPTMDNSTCCGFSGGVRMNYPSESIQVSKKEIDRVVEMGGDTIVTNCPGCIQNLIEANLIDERVEVLDLVEYLLMSLGESFERNDARTIELIDNAYKIAMPGSKKLSYSMKYQEV